jgi:D-arabinose 1-dehydrogenase-like Zn-dependent alcohol dehydrogenase
VRPSRTAATPSTGAYAEYAVADERYVVAVPAAVSSRDAAPLTCAGVTTFAAIKAADVQAGERVAIFGIGGLGHLALVYARLRGAVVIAVDEINACLEEILAGRVPARLVNEFSAPPSPSSNPSGTG